MKAKSKEKTAVPNFLKKVYDTVNEENEKQGGKKGFTNRFVSTYVFSGEGSG